MFVFLVSHPTPSASTLSQGIGRPNTYIFVMHVSLPINWTMTNSIIVMLNCGPMACPQTINMTARRFLMESWVDQQHGLFGAVWGFDACF
jgi:hypothetical protein